MTTLGPQACMVLEKKWNNYKNDWHAHYHCPHFLGLPVSLIIIVLILLVCLSLWLSLSSFSFPWGYLSDCLSLTLSLGLPVWLSITGTFPFGYLFNWLSLAPFSWVTCLTVYITDPCNVCLTDYYWLFPLGCLSDWLSPAHVPWLPVWLSITDPRLSVWLLVSTKIWLTGQYSTPAAHHYKWTDQI